MDGAGIRADTLERKRFKRSLGVRLQNTLTAWRGGQQGVQDNVHVSWLSLKGRLRGPRMNTSARQRRSVTCHAGAWVPRAFPLLGQMETLSASPEIHPLSAGPTSFLALPTILPVSFPPSHPCFLGPLPKEATCAGSFISELSLGKSRLIMLGDRGTGYQLGKPS